MVEKFSVRISENVGVINGHDNWFNIYAKWFESQEVDKLLVCREGGDDVRPHVHILVWYRKTMSTFRQRFKKQYPLLDGNKDYQMKKVEDNDVIPTENYICKANSVDDFPEVVSMIGYTGDDVKLFHQRYWELNKELKKKKEEKKKAKPQWIARVGEYLKDKYGEKRVWSYNSIDVNIIGNNVLEHMSYDAKSLDQFVYKRLTLGVLNYLNPRSVRRQMFDSAFPDLSGLNEFVDE